MQEKGGNKSKNQTLNLIVESIQAKKGNKIIHIDIEKLHTSICSHFLICDAQSSTQVKAIAREIEDQLTEKLKKKAFHKEGHQNGYWILLDYGDIIVHIFQEEARYFYNLEELWADGTVKKFQ